jgi:hypothetical protein
MTRTLLAATAMILALTGSALASYAPIKYTKSRAGIAAACNRLGSTGQGHGLDAMTGGYGCRNLANGNAVQCGADGFCADYSGDPRWKRIQILLKGGEAQKQVLSRT